MKKKVLCFATMIVLCLVMMVSGKKSVIAEVAEKGNTVSPTEIPEKNIMQEEDTIITYYLNEAKDYGGVPARNLNFTGDGVGVEPTPIPNAVSYELTQKKITEYFEANDKIYKVVTYTDWSANEVSALEANGKSSATNYKKQLVNCAREIWLQKGLLEYKIATINSSYEVWYYTTDAKVHLRSRNHTTTMNDSNYSYEIDYGNIVNTDGSVSYVTDVFVLIDSDGKIDTHSLNFVVTPTQVSFD